MDASKDAIVSNPVPVVMITIGLGWLLYKRRASYSRTAAVQQKAGAIAGKARETAEELSSEFKERGSRFASAAKGRAQRFSVSARDRAGAAGSRLRQFTHENPIGLVMGALAMGSLIGFSIPESRR